MCVWVVEEWEDVDNCVVFFFFFFKQKTAYEMLRSLVGSEMCIRDRSVTEYLEKNKKEVPLNISMAAEG